MKYLKIDNNKGFYLNKDSEPTEIDKITKEDLMYLLEKAVGEDFEMDLYEEEKISHKAHQIIYKNISEKFSELINDKEKFTDECNNQYKSAINTYQGEE